MNNLLVIVNQKSLTVLINVEKDAKTSQPDASGVKKISDRVWLIDPHTSNTFYASLLSSAHERGCETFVYEVLDTIQSHILPLATGEEPNKQYHTIS